MHRPLTARLAACLAIGPLLGGLVACARDTETVRVTEYDVLEVEVPVPGEPVVLEVPGETVVVEVEVPGETVVVEVPGETVVVEVPTAVVPPCGSTQPQGACDVGATCFGGECVATASLCSPTNLEGLCADGLTCFAGGCVLSSALCGASNPTGPCAVGSTCLDGACVATADLCSAANPDGRCRTGLACHLGLCGLPAEDPCAEHHYTEQPALGLAVERIPADLLALVPVDAGDPEPPIQLLTVDGAQFKDMNRNGALDPYEDWRLHESCRAWDLVAQMSLEQKLGTMSEGGRTGNGTADGSLAASTVTNIVDLHRRYSLVRLGSRSAVELAQYHNNVQALAEFQPLAIPVTIGADPAHGFGLSTNASDGGRSVNASAVVSPWPYPLGIGAINDLELTRAWADVVRQELLAMGISWQFGPMANLATEPRWARVQSTFGENAFQVAMHTRATIERLQAQHLGGLRHGVAATLLHFPGAGSNEAGMSSQSYPGRFHVYPGLHFAYHLIPFQAGIDAGAAAVMPSLGVHRDLTRNPEQVASGFSHTLITRLLKEEMGFDGMITGDWGTLGHGYNQESLTLAQRAAMWLRAGSHQLGSDNESSFRDAYDQGHVGIQDIDQAVAKLLAMTFRLGLFEDAYVEPAAAAKRVRSPEHLLAGLHAQKRAIVLLTNIGTSAGRPLPIRGSRLGLDRNGDGTLQIFFDGVVSGLNGSDYLTDLLGDYDYTAPASADSLAIAGVSSLADADLAVLRITARKGVHTGLDAGVPLSFDGPFLGQQNDATLNPALRDRNRVIDALRARDGYTNASGAWVAPTNPTLSIVVVMHFDRPGIVRPWIVGVNLDELPGVPGSYHLVSDDANVGGPGRQGVNALAVEFGAIDRAVLDFVFHANPLEGYPYGRARLPMELPSSDAAAQAQLEDVPADSVNPTFLLGAGLNLNP